MRDDPIEKLHLIGDGNRSAHSHTRTVRSSQKKPTDPNENYRVETVDASEFAKSVKFRHASERITEFLEDKL
jgi:hypothetical protein